MESVSIRVHGLPASKGSVTRMANGSYLPAGTKGSRMNYELWKDNIAAAARIEMQGREPWTRAIRLMAEFYMPTNTTIKKYQRGWLPHTKRPDIDKLTRALLDPLTGIVWVDDSQVCHAMINKLYSWDNQPGALAIIDFMDDEWAEEYADTHRRIVNVIDSL